MIKWFKVIPNVLLRFLSCSHTSFNTHTHTHTDGAYTQTNTHWQLFLISDPYLSGWPNVLILAEEKMFECLFKCDVAQSVAGRVDGAVDVAQPVANSPHCVGDAAGAEGVDKHHHIIRSPGGYKGYQDGHYGAGHLFLPWRRRFLLLVGRLLCHLHNLPRHVVLPLCGRDDLYGGVGRCVAVTLGRFRLDLDAGQLGAPCLGSLARQWLARLRAGVRGRGYRLIFFLIGRSHAAGCWIIGALLLFSRSAVLPFHVVTFSFSLGSGRGRSFAILQFSIVLVSSILSVLALGTSCVLPWYVVVVGFWCVVPSLAGRQGLWIGTRWLSVILLHTALARSGDLPVQLNHDDDRQVKGGDGGAKSDCGIREELDVALLLRHCPPTNNELPEEDGWCPEDERQDPGGSNHHSCHLGGPFDRVAEGLGDTEISVKAYDEKIHDRCIADNVVQG